MILLLTDTVHFSTTTTLNENDCMAEKTLGAQSAITVERAVTPNKTQNYTAKWMASLSKWFGKDEVRMLVIVDDHMINKSVPLSTPIKYKFSLAPTTSRHTQKARSEKKQIVHFNARHNNTHEAQTTNMREL